MRPNDKLDLVGQVAQMPKKSLVIRHYQVAILETIGL